MAQEEIALKITTESSQTERSVGNIRQQLRQANVELIEAQKNFGEYSQEALNAARKVAQLKDSIQEARETADLFDPGKKFQAFTGVLQTTAAGFAGLQGAIGLFGTESEELERQLLKVQSALALSEGLSAIRDGAKDFQRLGAIVKTQVVTAFTTLRGALIATGIGALAVGVGLLIANFEKVKQTIQNLFPGLGQLATYIGGLIEQFTDFLGITSELERASERLAKTNKERNEQIEREIKLLQVQGGQEAKIAQLQKEKVQNDIDVLNSKKKLTEEETKLLKDLEAEKITIDAAETKRLKDKADADAKIRQQKIDELKKIIDETRIENEIAALNEDSRESNRVAMKYEDLIKQAEQYGLSTIELEKARDRELTDIDNKLGEKFIENRIALTDELNALFENDFDADRARLESERELILSSTAITNERKLELLKENSEAVKAIDDAEVEAKRQNLEIISGLLLNFGGLVGEQTAAGKALAIAGATIDTYVAASRVFSDKSFAGRPFARFAAAAATIVAGLRNVKAIASVKVPSFGGTGGGGVNQQASFSSQAPIVSGVPIQQTSLVQGGNGVNLQNQGALRAYVVEKDITESQDRITKIKQAATI